MIPQNLRILLVEDDDIDAEAVRRGFKKSGVERPLYRASNGIQAIQMLCDESGPFFENPYIILLDLKMPRMNGIEFLQTIRKDATLRKSIVFVLTTSNDSQDRLAAYSNFVAGYITKSKAGSEFRDLIEMLDTYARIIEFPLSR
ncbi:response regulator [Bremerella sp. JC817]|uniref:response regulator n=1 Tax=Bremerella sp. JC817 TaxID=3231756 RepID=UPI0034592E77